MCLHLQASASQKRAVREVVSALEAFREVDGIRRMLHQLQTELSSPLLSRLIADMPDVTAYIAELEAAFDMDVAKASEIIELHKGSNKEYDDAEARRAAAEAALQALLTREKCSLHCAKLKFSSAGKDGYLLEVPADFPLKLVPSHYQLHR